MIMKFCSSAKEENYTRKLEKHIFYRVDVFDIVKDPI